MTERKIRVLLVDGKVEDSLWVQELLAEFEESRYKGGWMHGIEVFHLERLADALTLLDDNEAREQFDVVLLNPDLPDSFGLRTYLCLKAHAPDIAVVILSELDDPDLAISMTRAGAQDFVAKIQLDSMPLARSLRLAMERNLITRDLSALSWRDELTGLSNRNGFDTLAEHDLKSARRLGMRLAVVVIQLDGLDRIAFSYGKEEQQLALTEMADVLRSVFGESACLGRIGVDRFVASIVAPEMCDVRPMLARLESRFHLMRRKANRSPLQVRWGLAWDAREGTMAQLVETAAESAYADPMLDKKEPCAIHAQISVRESPMRESTRFPRSATRP
ncbi:MAG TPA: diguanylate cyclase [Bryobacteraceae bacterium]|nr:diguanylate cyclase [Bryobacteraceae bacterium]